MNDDERKFNLKDFMKYGDKNLPDPKGKQAEPVAL